MDRLHRSESDPRLRVTQCESHAVQQSIGLLEPIRSVRKDPDSLHLPVDPLGIIRKKDLMEISGQCRRLGHPPQCPY